MTLEIEENVQQVVPEIQELKIRSSEVDFLPTEQIPLAVIDYQTLKPISKLKNGILGALESNRVTSKLILNPVKKVRSVIFDRKIQEKREPVDVAYDFLKNANFGELLQFSQMMSNDFQHKNNIGYVASEQLGMSKSSLQFYTCPEIVNLTTMYTVSKQVENLLNDKELGESSVGKIGAALPALIFSMDNCRKEGYDESSEYFKLPTIRKKKARKLVDKYLDTYSEDVKEATVQFLCKPPKTGEEVMNLGDWSSAIPCALKALYESNTKKYNKFVNNYLRDVEGIFKRVGDRQVGDLILMDIVRDPLLITVDEYLKRAENNLNAKKMFVKTVKEIHSGKLYA